MSALLGRRDARCSEAAIWRQKQMRRVKTQDNFKTKIMDEMKKC